MLTRKVHLIAAVFFALLLLAFVVMLMKAVLPGAEFAQKVPGRTVEKYNPLINPFDFAVPVSNPYFTLVPGTKFVYTGNTKDGVERVETIITDQKKTILGVSTIVVWDRVWLDEHLIEETLDWYATDNLGNVWYFGENSRDVLDGKVVSTKGSWEAGASGALPGIIMPINPSPSVPYRQEYAIGVAEDMAQVLAVNVPITVAAGYFKDCVQTKDWNPLETNAYEYKYYCAEVGGLVYEVDVQTGEGPQLISIQKIGSIEIPIVTSGFPEPTLAPVLPVILPAFITQDQAIEIARTHTNGEVIDVEIERKFGVRAYVIEVRDAIGELDVIIDMETGLILGIER